MIDAAERIVAEQGMRAMTLKAVQRASGQANNSAAAYHFGSRIGLVDAVIEHRMAQIDAERACMLDELERPGGPLTVRRAVEAYVLPLANATIGRPGSCYARFLTQAMFDPELGELVEQHTRAESYRQVRKLFVHLAAVPAPIAELRAGDVLVTTLSILAVREGRDWTPEERDRVVADLVDIATAILAAPSSSTDRGPRPRRPDRF